MNSLKRDNYLIYVLTIYPDLCLGGSNIIHSFTYFTVTLQLSGLLLFPLPRRKLKAHRIYMTSHCHVGTEIWTNFRGLENVCSFLHSNGFQYFSASIFSHGQYLPIMLHDISPEKEKGNGYNLSMLPFTLPSQPLVFSIPMVLMRITVLYRSMWMLAPG